ncbi:MAG: hypothetical protein AAB176_13225 [Pseudomonadota bacterium]|jgi:hypothetical protein
MIDSRIALIHATPLAVRPIAAAFEANWPQAQLMNLLDDTLSSDLAKAGSLNQAMVQRIGDLASYAKAQGVHGILFTCSAFGAAIDVAKQTVGLSMLKPNEAMFDEALDVCSKLTHAGRIALLTTFAPAGASMQEELQAEATKRGLEVHIENICIASAMDELNAGNGAVHDALIVAGARMLPACDVYLLGQFSMARAKLSMENALRAPTLTSPDSAVRRMKLDLN